MYGEVFQDWICSECLNSYNKMDDRPFNHLCDWCHYVGDGTNHKADQDDLYEQDQRREVKKLTQKTKNKSKRKRGLQMGIRHCAKRGTYTGYYREHYLSFSISVYGEEGALKRAKNARRLMEKAKYHDKIELVIEDLQKEMGRAKSDPALPKGLCYTFKGGQYYARLKYKDVTKSYSLKKNSLKDILQHFALVRLRLSKLHPQATRGAIKSIMNLPFQDLPRGVTVGEEMSRGKRRRMYKVCKTFNYKQFVIKFDTTLYGEKLCRDHALKAKELADFCKDGEEVKRVYASMRKSIRDFHTISLLKSEMNL